MLSTFILDVLEEVLHGVAVGVTLLVEVEVLEDADVDVEAIVLVDVNVDVEVVVFVEDVKACEVSVLDVGILLVKVDVTVVADAM